MPRRKLGRESSPNHSETLLRCATALEGSRDVVGTGLAKKVRGQVVGVGGVLPLPHWDCIPAPPHTCPPPQAAMRGQMPTAPCGESWSQDRAAAQGGCGWWIDVTMVASTPPPSTAAWARHRSLLQEEGRKGALPGLRR